MVGSVWSKTVEEESLCCQFSGSPLLYNTGGRGKIKPSICISTYKSSIINESEFQIDAVVTRVTCSTHTEILCVHRKFICKVGL